MGFLHGVSDPEILVNMGLDRQNPVAAAWGGQ